MYRWNYLITVALIWFDAWRRTRFQNEILRREYENAAGALADEALR